MDEVLVIVFVCIIGCATISIAGEVYELKNKGDLSKFDEEKETFKESFLQEKQMLVYNKWVENLGNKYKIVKKLDDIEKQIINLINHN